MDINAEAIRGTGIGILSGKGSAIEKIGVVSAANATDAKTTLMSTRVKANVNVAVNANANLVGGTSGKVEQDLAYVSGSSDLDVKSIVEMDSAVNVSGKLGGSGTTVQSVGSVETEFSATNTKVKAKLKGAANVAVSVAGVGATMASYLGITGEIEGNNIFK